MPVTMRRVQKISREVLCVKTHDPSETTRRAPFNSDKEIQAYLQGALHDAYRRENRIRFSQKGTEWLTTLKDLLGQLGYRSWMYREGSRDVYDLETTAEFLDFKFDVSILETSEEKAAYIRGFFDAEGGIPHSRDASLYIQLVQKDLEKMRSIKSVLQSLGIKTGVLHNPSRKVDPNYWRCFVSTESHSDFARIIGSSHPLKRARFEERMMI
ncbi:MAG: LAGLIDADG family homing endonuclease [Candidatus Pacebacteria bacterium]|nr:LAGLIDADG family homing endonuclease [Candidatus Paceibacterota bacterium]